MTTIRFALAGMIYCMGARRWPHLSFPSLKDPRAHEPHRGGNRSHLFLTVLLKRFCEEPWKRRGTDYESSKKRITEALLNLVEQHHPGFRELVAYAELATPITFEFFTGAPSGTIYGYPATPEKFRKTWLRPRTPIRNLYLTGTDAAVLGVMGALMGGVATASTLLGPAGFLEIMRAANSSRSGARSGRD